MKSLKQETICLNCKNKFEYWPSQTAGKFCKNLCQIQHKKKDNDKRRYILFIEGKLKNRYKIKEFIIKRDGYRCSKCLLNKWLNLPITLWLDHIDGNASNNMPLNFRLVCPNCDSQSETFGGKNRGSGRKSQGLKPWQ